MAAIIFDGEMAQVLSLLDNHEGLRDTLKEANTRALKLPANCSSTIQPNDVGKTFLVFHSITKGKTYQFEADEMIAKICTAGFKRFGFTLSAQRRTNLIVFLSILKPILAKAFRADLVKEGWQKTGLHPFSAAQVLNQFTQHRSQKLTKAEEEEFFRMLPKLKEIAFEKGRILSSDFDELNIAKDAYNTVQEQSRPVVSDRPVYQQRTVWLDHGGVVADRRRQLEEKEVAEAM